MKIRFKRSPIGVFRLGYFVGDVVDMEEKQAGLLIDNGYAEPVSPKDDKPKTGKILRKPAVKTVSKKQVKK